MPDRLADDRAAEQQYLSVLYDRLDGMRDYAQNRLKTDRKSVV